MKVLSPGLMGLALLCFFLPWVSVSCSGNPVASFTGLQFVTGTSIQGPFESKAQLIPAYWPAIALLIIIAIGLFFCFSEDTAGSALATKIIALIFIIGIKVNMDDRILKEGQGLFQTKYEIGFILIALLMCAGLIIDSFIISQRKKSMQGAVSIPNDVYCIHCGTRNTFNDSFCIECGKVIERDGA